MFFEGTEKKLEIITAEDMPSLRSLELSWWEEISQAAGARILSKISNPHCDAYLLSESSLFVFDYKIIMITCGQTSLISAVVKFFQLISPSNVLSLVYERKNENFPHIQPSHFFEDVRILQTYLPGRSFRFGEMNEHHLFLFHFDRSSGFHSHGKTLEILMHGIDPHARKLFCADFIQEHADIHARTGIREILPGFHCDDYLFRPDGYSLNAIREAEYYTVHVTPEEISSYASFETNYRFLGHVQETIHKVIDIFRPKAYDLILFQMNQIPQPADHGYQMSRHVHQQLTCGLDVRFLTYFRLPTGIDSACEFHDRKESEPCNPPIK